MSFDLKLYQGRWYELVRTDAVFQQDCENATADYILNNKELWVINTCYRKGQPIRQSIGRATPTSKAASLNLKFIYTMTFGDTWGAGFIETPEAFYNVLWTDYQNFAFVEGGDNFWVLSRNANITEKEYYFVREKIVQLGYNPDQLQWT